VEPKNASIQEHTRPKLGRNVDEEILQIQATKRKKERKKATKKERKKAETGGWAKTKQCY
jgi:hypothetical protein